MKVNISKKILKKGLDLGEIVSFRISSLTWAKGVNAIVFQTSNDVWVLNVLPALHPSGGPTHAGKERIGD